MCEMQLKPNDTSFKQKKNDVNTFPLHSRRCSCLCLAQIPYQHETDYYNRINCMAGSWWFEHTLQRSKQQQIINSSFVLSIAIYCVGQSKQFDFETLSSETSRYYGCVGLLHMALANLTVIIYLRKFVTIRRHRMTIAGINKNATHFFFNELTTLIIVADAF